MDGDLKIITLSKVGQTEKDKHHMLSLIRGIQKLTQMNPFTKRKQTHRHRQHAYGYQRQKIGGEWGRDKLGV